MRIGQMYKKISEYGIIGNLQTVALIGRDGSMDWLCYPYIDSPSVFAALLDHEKGGLCRVYPDSGEEKNWDAVQSYIPQTNVLVTSFRTRRAILRLTDFMTVSECPTDDKVGQCAATVIYRKLEVEKGQIQVKIDFIPRFDYARDETLLESLSGGGVLAYGSNMQLALTATHPFELQEGGAVAFWSLKQGDIVWIRLGSSGPMGSCSMSDKSCVNLQEGTRALDQTTTFWRNWLARRETGCSQALGEYKDMLERSALVLKLLHYGPTGAIAAAATTSLPEEIGGVRNWDYRYTWIRDASFTLQALYNLGHLSETEGYLNWLEHVLNQGGVESMQIMYGLRGERELPEQELLHLDGYKGSRPVRIGNAAARQRQLDIYGELMDAILHLANYVGKIRQEHWPVLRDICDHVVKHWQEPDTGIWEVRGGPFHFVYSKVMCWVALDRGLNIAKRYGFPCDKLVWENAKQEIMQAVLEKGYDPNRKVFVQHFETDTPDAANLLIPMLGFLPFDDPRVLNTIQTVQDELTQDGLLYRYKSEDGLQGEEGVFLLCSFWLIDCLIALGRLREAEILLHRLEKTANHLGLFAEEFDLIWQEPLGNFPQAFTHIGYVNSAMNLLRAREREDLSQRKKALRFVSAKKPIIRAVNEFVHKKGLPHVVVLNQGQPHERVSIKDIAPKLRHTMNLLRGAYFDANKGRVAYEQMAESEVYSHYVDIARNLNQFDPGWLNGKGDKIAFWINLYNVIVVHGVVWFRVQDSVKEVSHFFKRIKYNIGGRLYSPEDIEHGILRANQRPPYALRKRFQKGDPRLKYVLGPEQFDPRIHFALVCASSSCPPIGLYTSENLDNELTLAAKTFCNAEGVILDRVNKKVSLSRIFSWYARDFGDSIPKRLRYLATFLYNPEDRTFLNEAAEKLNVSFQKYDWHLNRG